MKTLFFSILFFLSMNLLHAANITSNAVTGNWSNPASWVGGVVPGLNDSVIIVSGAHISLNTNATIYKVRISTGGILSLGSSTLKLNGSGSDKGSMSIYGTLNLNSGTLELTGDFFTGTSANPGTFNCGTGTVNFIGNEHQMITGHTPPVFHHFITSNTNNALQKGVTGHPVSTTFKGNFVANGVFNRSSQNNYAAKVVFDGNTSLSGAYSYFLHHVEINTGAILNANDKTIYLYGNWTNNGTFISGTSTLWFAYDPNHSSQPNQTISNINAATNPFNNIYINKSTGTVSPLAHPGDALNPMGHIWVNGNFTVNNGTWANGERQLWVKGDFIVNNGIYNAGLGRVILNGNTQQLLRSNTNSSFYKFTVDNTGGGVQLVSDIKATNELVLTSGCVFTTEAYEVYVSNNSTGAIHFNNSGSFIVGRLRREVISGAANYLFPIGPMNVTPLKYRPVTYQQTNSGGAANISMIADTISWGGTNTANWYVRIGSNAGNPAGNLLFQYHLGNDFPAGVNECALSVNRGTLPPPANWNYVLSTVNGAGGGSLGNIIAAIPSSLAPHAYILGEPVLQINNTSVCSGNSATLNVVQPTGSGNFNWYNAPSGGSLLQANTSSYTTPPLTNTITYYVAHVNNNTSCIANYRTPVTVTVGASMNVNIIPNGPTSICGNGSVQLDAGSGYTSYIWSTSATTQTITANTQGTYSVTVSDGMGCGGSGSINVSITPMPGNAPPISGPSLICIGTNGTFSISTVPHATSYYWEVPQGFSIISGQGSTNITVAAYNTGAGHITVTPQNSCGDGMPSSVNIMAQNAPEDPMPINGPSSVCINEIATYSLPFVQGANGYNWEVPPTATIVSGQNTASIVVDWGTASTGTITVVPYNDCGNGTATSIYVTVNQLPPAVGGAINGPVSVCQGEMVDYYIIPVSNASGYIWETPPGISILGGQNTTDITVLWEHVTSGYVKVTPTNGCGVGTGDSVYVEVLPAPAAPNLADTIWACEGQAFEIGVLVGNNVNVVWYEQEYGGLPFYTGDTLSLGGASGNQTFWVETQGANGCSNADGRVKVSVIVLPTPVVTLSSNLTNNNAIMGQTITFTALPNTYAEYEFFINGQSMQAGANNTYTTNGLQNQDIVSVTVSDHNACFATSDEIIINMSMVPNAFTPNGDGMNDIFMEGFDLVIINRWGQELYSGNEGWDGKYKGSDVSPGTYFYIISIVQEDVLSKITGAVALSR